MGLVYQKIKIQKIKEKYLGFQGGDLTPICLLICCLGFLIYIWSGPKIFLSSVIRASSLHYTPCQLCAIVYT